MTFRLDPQQQRAVAAEGNVLALAVPGSGKTAMLTVRGNRLLAEDSGRLAAVSFTTESADELKQKILLGASRGARRRVVAGTFHALAKGQIERSRGGGKVRLARPQQQQLIIADAVGRVIDRYQDAFDDLEVLTFEEGVKIIDAAKSSLRPPTQRHHRELVETYNAGLRSLGLMDFADLILESVAGMRNGSVQPLDVRWLLVDEGQDLDEVQHAWLLEHSKRGVEITLVADDDQCHPAGVLVSTCHGVIPIEELEASGSGIKYARRAGHNNHNSLELHSDGQYRRSVRPYSGTLLRIKAGGKELPVTPEHRLLVRLNAAASGAYGIVLSVFECGWVDFRVCRLLEARGAFGLGVPARKMGGGRSWLIDVRTTRSSARLEGRRLAAQYSLPMGGQRSTPDASIVAAARHDAEGRLARATQCLVSFGLDVCWPLLTTTSTKRGSRPFEVLAINAIAKYMDVPTEGDGGMVVWSPVSAIDRISFEGEVYSLDVRPSGLYSANGIVVHNSIYEWRNAQGYKGLLSFQKNVGAEQIILGNCYRCAPEILTVAGRVISRLEERMDKPLMPRAAAGGCVKIKEALNSEAEAKEIAIEVRESPNDWGVLARTNSGLRLVAGMLQKEGIPYTGSGEESIWKDRHAVALCDLLLAITSGEGTQILNVMSYLGFITMDLVGTLRVAHLKDAREILVILEGAEKEKVDGFGPIKKARDIARFCDNWDRWRRLQEEGRLGTLIESASSFLRVQKKKSRVAQFVLGTCALILSRLDGSIAKRIDDVMRRKRDDDDGQERGVRLLTLHASKGLEFQKVWILGCNQGLTPHKDGKADEERRLFYVGMTRAKRELWLSWTIGENQDKPEPVSDFIYDAGLRTR